MCFRFLFKSILIIVNLLCTLIGLALVGIGIAVLIKLDDIFEEIMNVIPINLKLIPYFVIGIGSVIFLIAFCGCCGSITESKCMLLTYTVCMALLAAFKIFVAIELSTKLGEMRETVDKILSDVFVDPSLNMTFHTIETTFECCGTTGPAAYNISINATSYVPSSCCAERYKVEDFLCLTKDAYETGCNGLVIDLIEDLSKNSRIVLIVIIGIEVLLMASALFVSCTINNK